MSMTETGQTTKSERVVLAVVTLSHLAQHFNVGLSVLYPEIMIALGLNYTQLGVMTGASSMISGFLQMLWSILNRYLSRRILLGMGNLLIAVGTLLTGAATRFIDLVTGTVVSRIGTSVQHPVGSSIVSQKFTKDRVTGALSIHYGLGYVGNIISPVFLSSIALVVGWRQAIYVLAVIPLITSLLLFYFLRGEASASKSIQIKGSRFWEDARSIIRIKGVILIIAAQAFIVGGTGMGVIITYTPLFLENVLKLETLESSFIYSFAVVGGVLGTIVFGHLATRFGNLKIASFIAATCSLLIFFLVFQDTLNPLLILQFFFIAATGFTSSSLLQAHLAAISTPSQRDILLGLYFTIGFGTSSVWTTITGIIIDVYGFNSAWIFRAVLGAIAFVILFVATRQYASPASNTSEPTSH
jgi:FSR family fosmidomycin resistance protein-like MFS transporter